MRVRTATRYDIPQIMTMLRHFAEHAPIDSLQSNHNELHIRQLLTNLILGLGRVFIAEDSDVPAGMLVAHRTGNIWNPDVITVSELAFWVEPWARNTTAAHRLLRAYEQYAQEQTNTIGYTLSKLNDSPYDPTRLGYRLIEQQYIKQTKGNTVWQ